MKNTISLIIVHWNTPDLLNSLLLKLVKSDSLEIIVVDNDSDQSISSFKKSFPQVSFIMNKKNLGFAMACNQGAEQVTGQWLLFLNPDVNISPTEIQDMLEYAEANQIDALSPNPESKAYAKPLPSPLILLLEFTPLGKLLPASKTTRKTLTGGCLLIKKDVLSQLGGWDEDFFLWFEDSDLTKRLYDANYAVGWYPRPITHQGASSIKLLSNTEQKKLFFHSMKVYAKKHFTLMGQLIVDFLAWWN